MKKKNSSLKASLFENSPPKREKIVYIPEIIVPPHDIITVPIDDPPYNPKICNKRRLGDFIPGSLSISPASNVSRHTIDFYLENKSSLIIFESPATVPPSNMKDSYSDFSSWISNMKFKDTIYTNHDAELHVNSYESESREKYVIKKSWHYNDHDKRNINTIFEMESFIRVKLMNIVL